MSDLRRAVDALLGTPYLDGGRDIASGLDCWGVVRAFHRIAFGIELPAYDGEYASSEEEREVAKLVAREAIAGPFRRAPQREPGDVLRMWWTRPDDPSHVAIYLGGDDFLHARRGGVAVESLTDEYWARRVVDYWRHTSRLPTWNLRARPNPLSDEAVDVESPVGATLFDGLMAAGVRRDRDGGYVRVLVGGVPIPKEFWHHIRPKAGIEVTAVSVPGPPVAAFLAGISAAIASSVTAATVSLGIALGSTTLIGAAGAIGSAASTLVGLGLSLGISFLASSLAAPGQRKLPSGALGPAQSPQAQGVGNQITRWGKCSYGIGTMRVTPALAAPAYTEVIGGEKFWRILLEVGLGRYQIDQTAELGVSGIQVGGIPIEQLRETDGRTGWEIYEGGTQSYVDAVLDVEPFDDSPDAYWRLGDAASPATDEQGGPSLAQSGGVTFAQASILPAVTSGASVLFDGVDDYLESTSGSLPLADFSGDWTVECWCQFDLSAQGGSSAIVWYRGVSGDGVGFVVDVTNKRWVVALGGVATLAPSGSIPASGSNLYHTVVRRRSGSIDVWINGAASAVLSTATPAAPSSRLTVGAYWTGAAHGSFLKGNVQELAAYSVALSDDEIRLHHQLGTTGRFSSRMLVDTVREVPINTVIEGPKTSDGEWFYSNWITRSIDGAVDELGFEIFFAGGLYRIDTLGKKNQVNVGIQVEYKLKSASTWLQAVYTNGIAQNAGAGYAIYANSGTWGSGTVQDLISGSNVVTPDGNSAIVVGRITQDSFLLGFNWQTQRGEYELRYRTFAMHTSTHRGGGADTAAFVADHELLLFRGTLYNAAPIRVDGLALVGVKVAVKETGSTVGQITVLRKRMLSEYDPLDPKADANGMTPERVANGDNAVWAALDMFTGPHFATRPLDVTKFNLAQLADAASRSKPCHLEIDFATNVWDGAQLALAGSFMSVGYAGSKYTVVEDRAGQTARALATPRNGASWKGVKRFPDLPHAFRVAFLDATKEWQETEVLVFDDGYNEDGSGGNTAATKYDTLDARGITDRTLAIEYGKRRLRSLRLRSEEWTVTMWLDTLVSKRGDVVRANIPMALVGQKSARVISVHLDGGGDVDYVLLDENVDYEIPPKTYGARFRIPDPADSTQFALIYSDVANPATVDTVETNQVTFATPLVSPNIPAVGSLFTFGEQGVETMECLVREIGRRGYEADVTLIPYAPEIFNDVDEPAVFDPVVTRPVPLPLLKAPYPPIILWVSSEERLVVMTPSGPESRMLVYVRPKYGGRGEAAWIQARVRLDNDGAPTPQDWQYSEWVEKFPASILFAGVEDGSTYEIQARAQTRDGATSQWSDLVRHTITWGAAPPPNVKEVRVEGDELRILYPARETVKDFDGFLIRYVIGWNTHAGWATATPAHTGVWRADYFPTSNFPREDSPVTFLVRAADLRGTLSTGTARVVLPFLDPAENAIVDHDHRDYIDEEGALSHWPGTKDNCSVSSGDLVADQTDTTDDQAMWRAEEVPMWTPDRTTTMWNQAHSLPMAYTASFIPIGEEIGSQLRWPIAFAPAHAIVEKTWREQGNTPMWTDDSAAMWTDDAASMWVGWSEWRRWTGPIEHPRRYAYELKASIRGVSRQQSKLTAFDIVSDVPDRRDTFNDIIISAAGSRIPVSPAFHRVDRVAVTIQSIVGETASSYRVFDKQIDGPLIALYDADGTAVAGTVDVEVIGY